MPRETSLESLMFPVVQEKLYSLRADSEDELRPIEHHSAIIRRDTGKVLGVVDRYHRLVTHAEAVELGRRCVRELLGLDAAATLEVFQVHAFSDGSLCYVDLMHPSYRMNLLANGASAEVYVPYVRVTNSYNGLRPLSFDVGFCRSLCANGVIFERETIRFSHAHARGQLRPSELEFSIKAGQFAELAGRFQDMIHSLCRAPANDADAEATMARIVKMPTPDWMTQTKDRFWRARYKGMRELAWATLERYRAELGHNHYALFNAMTELARTFSGRPRADPYFYDRHKLERAVGVWAMAFHARAVGQGDWQVKSSA